MEFTKFSEGTSAEVLVGVLNDISTRFDRPTDKPDAERARIIGDAYVAAVGLSDSRTAHAIRASQKALDLTEAMDRFNAHSRYQLKIRIGFDASTGAASGDSKRSVVCDL